MQKKERQSNIELLRVLAIIGVIVLHYNNPLIGGGITYAEEGSVNFYVLYILESLFACGVNLFMLISGYFMCESKKRNLRRPIELIVQVMIFREAMYLARVAFDGTPFSVKTMMTTLLPVNYFVILYCVVYLLSPYINLVLDKLSHKSLRTLIILLVAMFAFHPTIVDVLGELRGEELIGLSSVGMYGSQWGYSIVNFMLMYILGAYLRRGNSKIARWKQMKLLLTLLGTIVLLVAWARVNDKVGFFTERSAWEYCNPFVILTAVLVFLLFSKIDMGVNKVINKLAEGVFSVFLLHNTFIPYLRIEQFVTGNVFLMLLHIIFCCVVLYLICLVAHKIYHLIIDPIFKVLSGKAKLPTISVED